MNHQLSTNSMQSPLAAITTTSSGDDHLLTANADEAHFGELAHYHKGKHQHHFCHDNRAFQYHYSNQPHNKAKGGKNDDEALDVVIIDPHNTAGNGTAGFKLLPPVSLSGGLNMCTHMMRKRHNATQTPEATLERWLNEQRPKAGEANSQYCSCCVARRYCCERPRQRTRHHHHHHHHHRHQHQHKRHQQQQQLPLASSTTTTKSSLQQIAIEIDAASLTEDNASTATSNFAYKMAARNSAPPIIMAPMRRCSLQSNNTSCSDELSNDDAAQADVDEDDLELDDDQVELTPRRQRHKQTALNNAQNAGVHLQRKRYDPTSTHDYCSSCSSCSCCDGQTSSCSSLEAEENVAQLTVLADCHFCADAEQPKDYCSCADDDSSNTAQMCTAREYSHSSQDEEVGDERTLTPLSSVGTQSESQQQTLQEEASESAEFYSLSSCPAPKPTVSRPTCRHHCHRQQDTHL